MWLEDVEKKQRLKTPQIRYNYTNKPPRRQGRGRQTTQQVAKRENDFSRQRQRGPPQAEIMNETILCCFPLLRTAHGDERILQCGSMFACG